jgi:hypothetical protein
MTLHLGILLALLCALLTNLGFLLKHRGARAAPEVRWRHPLRTAVALFQTRVFAIGWTVTLLAWTFHVGALALAPLSVVQATLSGGLVFLAVLAERVSGLGVGRRQWLGVGLTALGLSLLAITLPGHEGTTSAYSPAGMISFEAGLLVVGTLLLFSPQLGAPRQHHGAMLGTAAGVLFGVSDVGIKALTGLVGQGGLVAVLSPWLAAGLLAMVLAFYAQAHGFQKGEAIPVITMATVAANISVITGGIVVFGDPLPADALGIVAQFLAFALVVVAAVLMPAPLRAARAQS